MKINRDFFGFSENEIRNWLQPNFEKIVAIEEIVNNSLDISNTNKLDKKFSNTKILNRNRSSTTTVDTLSDIIYVSPRTKWNGANNGKLQIKEHFDINSNSLEPKEGDVTYEKQLMQFSQEGVLDFALETVAFNTETIFYTKLWTFLALYIVLFMLNE